MSLPEDVRLGVWGAGRMAEALVRGLFAARLVAPARVFAVDPDPARRAVFAAMGADASDAPDAVADAEVVLLAVKPQTLPGVLPELAARLPARAGGTLVASLCAGVPTAKIAAALPPAARVARVMPNLPMTVGAGAAAVARGPGATDADLARLLAWFGAAGYACAVEERLMDAVTAVSGSGPAYAFLLAEAMAKAGEAEGLAPELAAGLARAAVAGAGTLLARDPAPPAEWRARVTSPGGTTAAALASFARDDFDAVVARAVAAARARGEELGRDA